MSRRFIFLLKSRSKVSTEAVLNHAWKVRPPAFRTSRRLRRVSSSLTRVEMKSIGVTRSGLRFEQPGDQRRRTPCRRGAATAVRVVARRDSFGLLGHVVDEIAVLSQLADERIDLAQRQLQQERPARSGGRRRYIEHASCAARSHSSAGGVGGGAAVLPRQRQHAQDALHADLAITAVDLDAKRANLTTAVVRSCKQLRRGSRT